jgi:hypothetical protein
VRPCGEGRANVVHGLASAGRWSTRPCGGRRADVVHGVALARSWTRRPCGKELLCPNSICYDSACIAQATAPGRGLRSYRIGTRRGAASERAASGAADNCGANRGRSHERVRRSLICFTATRHTSSDGAHRPVNEPIAHLIFFRRARGESCFFFFGNG